MGFSRHATALRSTTMTSELKVFTLYWRPLRKHLSFLLALPAFLMSCRRTPPVPPLFVAVAPEASGITFANTLPPDDSALNIVNYLYYYNGGGVAAGDIDGDGLMDLYFTSNLGANRLYRNLGNFRFEDITARAGVADSVGWKSGVTMADVNGDGRLDIYVSGVNYRGMQGRNVLYINNANGTFTESIAQATGHTSRFSMGADAADFNNDGRPDIAVLDMLPDSEAILKTAATTESYSLFSLKLAAGYHYQYARNTLQLNRGVVGGKLRFSEIGLLAGIAATDWSWAPLFADFDNDGRKDLFVTTGVYRRPNDLDYIASFDSIPAGVEPPIARLIAKMPHVPRPNYAFHNNGDLTFTNLAAAWGLNAAGFSNGAAYVDLDNDGALDLVVNNLNAPAAVYRNQVRDLDSAGHHYLTVALRGAGANTAGIGAKVILTAGGTHQLVGVMPTRGFESSVDPRAHFGLGQTSHVDSLTVIWPDRRYQVLENLAVDRIITLSQAEARSQPPIRPTAQPPPLFSDITDPLPINYKHKENTLFDFGRKPLMPHLLSIAGPALAVGDVNGDGRDDIYVGGAKWQAGRLFIQRRDGTFRASPQGAFQADSLSEDVDAVFFDANGDGHADLYVVSGGNEFEKDDAPLQDRLYLNDGRGHFHRDSLALPRLSESGSCVVPGDWNGDGHLDLFVGRRVVSRHYGLTPRSCLLENDGTGHFRDVTLEKAPALAEVGMVTSAAWVDYDHDGKLDLIVVGEWMPVRVFHQENGRLVDRTAEAGLAGTEGWWNSVTVADLNGDGRPDLVLGNLGLNSYIRASVPVQVGDGD